MPRRRQLLDPDARDHRRRRSVGPGSMIPGPRRRRSFVIKAVFFDVDFTLIYPGPDVPGRGVPARLRRARHRGRSGEVRRGHRGIVVHPRRGRGADLQRTTSSSTTPRRSSRRWAAAAPTSSTWRSEIYDQWSVNHHFEMYDDVAPVLEALQKRGLIVGVISNSHRSLDAFREHFSLAQHHHRVGVGRRARLHEAAPQHLRRRARSREGQGRMKR